MIQRNSSIELLRIISILLIIMMHISSLVDYNEASMMNKMWLGVINAIGNCGVSCFILISGYYGVRFNKNKFLYLIILTTIYTLMVSLLNNGINYKSSFIAILGIPLYTDTLWFIVCYLALMLLSPYINTMLDVLSEIEFRKMLIILCVLLSIIPSVFYYPSVNGVMLAQGGKCLSYFIFIYFIGRYIRLHRNVNINNYSKLKYSAWGRLSENSDIAI